MALIDGLISYWELDDDVAGGTSTTNGPGGTTAADSHGANHGTAVSTALWASGVHGSSFDFDSNRRIGVGASNTLDLTSAISLAAWINPDTAGETFGRIFDRLSGSTGYSFFGQTSGTYKLAFAPGGGVTVSSTGTVPFGSWTHVAVTVSGTAYVLYLNGVESGSGTLSKAIDSALGVTGNIGGRPAGDRDFDGLIDELGIWNRALTATEIELLFAQGIGIAYPLTDVVQVYDSPGAGTLSLSGKSNIRFRMWSGGGGGGGGFLVDNGGGGASEFATGEYDPVSDETYLLFNVGAGGSGGTGGSAGSDGEISYIVLGDGDDSGFGYGILGGLGGGSAAGGAGGGPSAIGGWITLQRTGGAGDAGTGGTAGGGGGGSGGTNTAGGNGSGATGGAGGIIGGGAGGAGGAETANGSNGVIPGGGGGGGGDGVLTVGGNGANGRIVFIYTPVAFTTTRDVKVIGFRGNIDNTTGFQDFLVSGLGPAEKNKGILLWSTVPQNAEADGTPGDHARWNMGMAIDSSNQCLVTNRMRHGVTSDACGHRAEFNHCWGFTNPDSNVYIASASFVGFIENGFRLNVDDAPVEDRPFNALIFHGDNLLADLKIVECNPFVDGTAPVAIDFVPNLVVAITSGDEFDNSPGHNGYASNNITFIKNNGGTTRAGHSITRRRDDDEVTDNYGEVSTTDIVITDPTQDQGAIDGRYRVHFDTPGFMTVTTINPTNDLSPPEIAFLLLHTGACEVAVGIMEVPTTASGATTFSGASFDPSFNFIPQTLGLIPSQMTAINTFRAISAEAGTAGFIAVSRPEGLAAGDIECCVTVSSENGLGAAEDSNAQSLYDGKVFNVPPHDGSTNGDVQGTFGVFIQGGFTATVTAAPNTDLLWPYFAIEEEEEPLAGIRPQRDTLPIISLSLHI